MDKYTRFLIDSGAMEPSEIGTSRDIARIIRERKQGKPTPTEQEITERTGFTVAEQQDVNAEMLSHAMAEAVASTPVRFRPLPGGGAK